MPLNLGLLEAFHAVAKDGAITRAAKRLFLTQPAVTRSIHSLEKSLKVQLFQRLPRGVRLTEAGLVRFEHTNQIFGLVESAEQAVADVHGLQRGRLRLGSTPSLASHLVAAVLVRLRQRFKQIDVRFEVESAATLFERIQAGVLEFGLTDVAAVPDGLDAVLTGEDPLVGIMARSRKRLPIMTLEQFCSAGLIVRRADGNGPSYVERLLMAERFSVQPRLVLGSSEAVKRAVAAGLGVAIVGRMTVDLELKAKEVEIVKLAKWNARRRFFVVRRSGSRESKPAIAFACLLRDEWRRRQREYAKQR